MQVAGAVRTVTLGLVGGGTVGGGIVEILREQGPALRQSLGVEFKFTSICVSDMSKARDFVLPDGCQLTSNVHDVLDDPSVEVVIEVMGGTTLAKDVVLAAMKSGKHVITANKALIAANLPDIAAAHAAANKGAAKPVHFGYEAAVCGGIPIIKVLQRDLLGDKIEGVRGIINGCTNYMLSSMASTGCSYTDCLKGASELGYAEADPTLDVGGFDARSKLKILIELAFGISVEENDIPVKGITGVTATDFEYAKMQGGTVKLLGVAGVQSNQLYGINGATNAVQLLSKYSKETVLVGQGAGRFPTANSCVSDLLQIVQGTCAPPFPKEAVAGLAFKNDYSAAFYIRMRYRDQVGITRDVGAVCEKNGISIHSMMQNPVKNRNDAMFVIITEPCLLSQVKLATTELERLDWCKGDSFYMPSLM
ncbi:homoserine dehydrogenase-domain-containing protein [Pavlovales sp. CCMP2436]|nr:homoserine dehydrogenase-domain-containing protein [Pavlovales sp. CCMP2436]